MKIIFNSLQIKHIHEIIEITLDSLFARIHDLGFKVELSSKAKDFLADKGFDPQYGARPLNRAIQKYLEDLVAELGEADPRLGVLEPSLNRFLAQHHVH